MLNTQLADLGHGIYLGNYEACIKLRDQRDLKIVHITENNKSLCGYCGPDLISWDESDLVSDSILERVAGMVKGDDKVLIHCQAGMNRGPTLAFMALLIRGVNVANAYLSVSNAMLTEYAMPVIPYWKVENLNKICHSIGALKKINI